MLYLLFGFLLFWLVLGALKAFAQANPAVLARLIRRGGGAGALIVAVFLLLRGAFSAAMGFAGLGFWLLNVGAPAPWSFFRAAASAARGTKFGAGPARVSCVRSAMIEMELDHETGKMRGVVLAGPEEGKALELADASAVRTPLWPLPSRRSGGRPTSGSLSRSPVCRLAFDSAGSRRPWEPSGAAKGRDYVPG